MATADSTEKPPSTAMSLVVPMGLLTVVLLLVIPIPPVLLDLLLAVSLAAGVGVFLIALFIEKSLEFSAFPTVVLIATLLRLSLNVATTRLILLHGADGNGSAGKVVETFGRFVVGGNVIVGLVIFLILVIINFVVITKGAGRVAEVAARFTLDAMPGKQMAIDADLNAGLITSDVARDRRKSVEREADFFGAMDGASKFVHGDAVAGLLITGINLVGGLIIGVVHGMDIAQAGETFSILSVGDALVSQVPALLVSTAAGIVVTRSATGEDIGSALATQMLGSRRAVGLTAGILTLFALVPGMPAFPFLLLAGSLGYYAYSKKAVSKSTGSDGGGGPAGASDPAAKAGGNAEEIEAALPLDTLALEVGYELIAAVDTAAGGTLLDRIGTTRRQFALDMGMVIPPVRVRDNLALEPGEYRFVLLGTEIARATLRGNYLLAMNASGTASDLDSDRTTDPVFGMEAYWILPRDRELAEALGYTVVDHATIMATHMGEIVRQTADQLLGRAELAHLFEVFTKTNPKLTDDLVPNLLSMSDVLKVLRNLLKEGVSIRDLRTIIEALLEIGAQTKDTEQLTEVVRQRLARQLTSSARTREGLVHAIVLDPQVEDMFRRSLQGIAQGTGGALDPDVMRRLGQSLESAVGRQKQLGRAPVLLTAPDLRRYVRAFAERKARDLSVLSFREIDASTSIKPVETVSADMARAA